MKVLVVSLNQLDSPISVLPVGAAMVCHAAALAEHKARFLDFMFQKDPQAALGQALLEFSPDVICLSIRNLDNQVMQAPESYLEQAKRTAVFCRENSGARLVLGGAAMQVMGPELMEALGAHYGIAGPGERELPELLNNLNMPDAENLRYARPEFDPVLSHLPPADMFDPAYFVSGKLRIKYPIGYQTARGCGAGCIYCSHAHTPPARISLDMLKDDLERLTKEYHAGGVTFTDDIFNQDESETMEICETIVKTEKPISWTCSLRPGVCSDGMVKLMKQAGCAFVDLGIDSACDKMLEWLGKGFHTQELLAMGTLLERHGIPYSVSLLFGGPGECRETVQETVCILDKLHPFFILAGMGLRVYPRTRLCEIAREEGADWTDSDLLRPKFYCSAGFTEETLRKCASQSAGKYKTMLMKAL